MPHNWIGIVPHPAKGEIIMDTTVETISINGIEYVKKGTGSKRIIVADSWATARIMMTGV